MEQTPPALRFRADGTFTIVQFTDLHVQNGQAADLETAALMCEVLDAERPDLVVLTGDVIYGLDCADPLRSWTDAVTPILDRNLPWAAVFGNHDDEGAATRDQLMAFQMTLPGCLSSPGPASPSGVGNYTLPVLSGPANVAATTPAARLYFLDSHGYADQAHKEYAWIHQDQIDWFLKNAADQPCPSLVFFHIPLPEFNDVWNAGGCDGSKHEPVCCASVNSGFFDAMKSAGNVLGAFVGHDHVNDFTGELAGIRLCYGRATGYNTYGREQFPRGARIISLQDNGSRFETRVKLR
jgi:3',5'-cyclic AMP phosphodiesterase CpdA